jgi:hypothetical protein
MSDVEELREHLLIWMPLCKLSRSLCGWD